MIALLTAIFLLNGLAKLTASQMQVDSFAHWGYPSWFMYVTGLIEVVCAVLLWPHRTRLIGALGIVAVMLGAIVTHILHAEWSMLPGVGVLLLQAALIALLNRPTR